MSNIKKVRFIASDGAEIVGSFCQATGPQAVLAVPMMPADKSSYQTFQEKLFSENISSLAIDLRGHGESSGGPKGYLNFEDSDHQKSILDLEAASRFLVDQGFGLPNQLLIGASIGANLCLQFAVDYSEIRRTALLSAGFDYRGISARELIEHLQPGQGVLIAGSEDDDRGGGAETAKALFELIPAGVKKEIVIYQAAGHGTDMFGKEQPDLESLIIRFFQV